MGNDSRVEAGAKLLDVHYPGWWKHVDVSLLDMGSCRRCILGQIYGDVLDGYKRLGIKYFFGGEDDRELGFERRLGLPEEYAFLDTQWIAAIKSRLNNQILREDVRPDNIVETTPLSPTS